MIDKDLARRVIEVNGGMETFDTIMHQLLAGLASALDGEPRKDAALAHFQKRYRAEVEVSVIEVWSGLMTPEEVAASITFHESAEGKSLKVKLALAIAIMNERLHPVIQTISDEALAILDGTEGEAQ